MPSQMSILIQSSIDDTDIESKMATNQLIYQEEYQITSRHNNYVKPLAEKNNGRHGQSIHYHYARTDNHCRVRNPFTAGIHDDRGYSVVMGWPITLGLVTR